MADKQKTVPVIDVDSHILEPAAIWDDYVAPEYRPLARASFWYEFAEHGPDTVVLNGSPAPPMRQSGINRLAVYRPGMTPQEIGALDPQQAHPPTPGARDAAARLQDMDAMGVDQALLMPTLFAEYFPVIENPDIAAVLARAYNDWVRDFAAAAPERLFPAAVLPMQAPALAIRELERVAGLGFKAAFIRPSFFRRKMPNHRDYDGLWAALEHTGVAACIHPSPGFTNPEWTSEGPFIERVAANLRVGHPLSEAVAPGMDNGIFLSALCFLGHMETYPNLKLGYLHSGAYWAPLALEKSETYLWLAPQMKPVSLEPAEVFYGRPSLVSFDSWESAVRRLVDLYEGIAAWGSRYPHHDATDAWEAIENLQEGGVPGDVVRRYMGGNAADFFGIAIKAA
ncbi:MAG: amidohydrolase family protein [Dehalococcoidia bacterium]